MVAGKVIKAAMGGFQKSPSSTPRHHRSSSPISTSHNNTKSSSSSGFSRYFPRTTSSQVQPRVSNTTSGGGSTTISDLLRLVEELQEKESRLKTELLEHKILKETASIVPILEEEIARKNEELERERWKVKALEEENEEMRLELEKLRSIILFEEESREVERRIEDVESEIVKLKKAATLQRKNECFGYNIVDDDDDDDLCSLSKRCDVVVVVEKKNKSDLQKTEKRIEDKSNLQKTEKRIEDKSDVSNLPTTSSPEMVMESVSQGETEVTTVEVPESLVVSAMESRNPRVPRPPPAPTSSSSSSSSSSVSSSETPTGECGSSKPLPPPPPPLPAPPRTVLSSSSQPTTGGPRPLGPPPPPPPLPPSKGGKPPAAKVRRVPEVVEFYHSLMRRDSKREYGSGLTDTSTPTSTTSASSAASAKDMIGEIENRSAYLLAIKTEVETQGDFIKFLIKEVNNAAFTNIEDVVAFVKWLDDELSFLVDERAVLKHFDWPEKKADAMREAAFGYSDLKKLESEAAALRDDCHHNCSASTKKMQALLEKLEHGVYNLSRVREAAMRRYKGFRIPWEWMLDTGLMSQIKLASVKLAMKYMKRVSAELEAVDGVQEEEDLVLQGVRFAFRVHQFAGGFDVETMKAFQELRDKSSSCQVQSQSQNHNRHNQTQKLVCCKSTTDC